MSLSPDECRHPSTNISLSHSLQVYVYMDVEIYIYTSLSSSLPAVNKVTYCTYELRSLHRLRELGHVRHS